MPKFLNNVSADWGSHYTTCENCGGRYHKSEGYCCEPEPQTGKAKTLEGFEEQLAGLYDWEELTRLMHETKCPRLLAFFKGLALPQE